MVTINLICMEKSIMIILLKISYVFNGQNGELCL